MNVVCSLLNLYTLVIFASAVASFFPISSGSPFLPVVLLLRRLTEPVYAQVRRVIPPIGMFDLSPIVVILGIQILAGIIC